MAGITPRDGSAQELKPSEKDDSDLSQIKESGMICEATSFKIDKLL